MLLRQHGGGNQHRHLVIVLHGLECGAQGHLGLAKAYVAADQAIHRLGVLQVALHFLHSAQLIFRLHVGEAGFQFGLPGCVLTEGHALRQFACSIQLQHVARHLGGRAARLLLRRRPFAGAQLVQRGARVLASHVARHAVKLMQRNV